MLSASHPYTIPLLADTQTVRVKIVCPELSNSRCLRPPLQAVLAAFLQFRDGPVQAQALGLHIPAPIRFWLLSGAPRIYDRKDLDLPGNRQIARNAEDDKELDAAATECRRMKRPTLLLPSPYFPLFFSLAAPLAGIQSDSNLLSSPPVVAMERSK